MLYHLMTEQIPGDLTGEFRPPSLATEGFIHLCCDHQVEWVANQFLQSVPSLWAAAIDPDHLDKEKLKFEDPGLGEKFPHFYSPLPFRSIQKIIPLSRGEEGEWKFQGG